MGGQLCADSLGGVTPKSPPEELDMKPASLVAVLVFSVVAVLHLLRLVLQLEVLVAGAVVPMSVSVLGFLVTAALAGALWREARSTDVPKQAA